MILVYPNVSDVVTGSQKGGRKIREGDAEGEGM